MSGFQVARTIRTDENCCAVPIIFLTILDSFEGEKEGLETGGIDYITKPFNLRSLRLRVRNHLELKRSRDQLEALGRELTEKNKELEKLAREDCLTGLANRRHFDDMLDVEIKRAIRTRQFLSLLLCDVDHFKRFNDLYGHVAGDCCLQKIGTMLRSTFMRAGDVTARYGGEEFAVILPETTLDNARLLAERLRQKMIAEAIPHAQSDEIAVVTFSIGVVGSQVSVERNAAWYIGAADRALYQSKENGRNQVSIAQT